MTIAGMGSFDCQAPHDSGRAFVDRYFARGDVRLAVILVWCETGATASLVRVCEHTRKSNGGLV